MPTAFPKVLVAAAPFYRIEVPTQTTTASLRAARAGARLLVIVGVTVVAVT